MKSHRGSYIDPCTCPAMSDDNQSGESPESRPVAPAADPVMDAGQAFALALIDRIGDLEARLDRLEFPARYD